MRDVQFSESICNSGRRPSSLDDLTSEVTALRKQLDIVVQTVAKLPKFEATLDEIRDRLTRSVKPFLTVDEVAEISGRAPFTVRRWIKEGLISAQRIKEGGPRGRLLIARDQIDKLLHRGHGAAVPDAICS